MKAQNGPIPSQIGNFVGATIKKKHIFSFVPSISSINKLPYVAIYKWNGTISSGGYSLVLSSAEPHAKRVITYHLSLVAANSEQAMATPF